MSVLDCGLNEHKKQATPRRVACVQSVLLVVLITGFRLRAACTEECEELGDIKEVELSFTCEVCCEIA